MQCMCVYSPTLSSCDTTRYNDIIIIITVFGGGRVYTPTRQVYLRPLIVCSCLYGARVLVVISRVLSLVLHHPRRRPHTRALYYYRVLYYIII